MGCTAAVAGLAALAFLPPERRTGPAEPATPTAVGATAGRAPVGANAGSAAAPGLWLRIQPLVRLGLWSVCFNAAYGAWITTFSAYSTTELGLAPSHVVLYFGAFGLGAILIGPTLARIADRTGRRRMIAIGTGMIFVGTVALIAVKAVPPAGVVALVVIYVSAAVAGGGISAAQSSWFALLGVATDGGRRGRSFGLVSALSNLGDHRGGRRRVDRVVPRRRPGRHRHRGALHRARGGQPRCHPERSEAAIESVRPRPGQQIPTGPQGSPASFQRSITAVSCSQPSTEMVAVPSA